MSRVSNNEGGKSLPPVPPRPDEATARRRPSRLRIWLFRLSAMTVVPALFFGVLELSLRLAGFGHSTAFFQDGAERERPGVWIDNPLIGRWVFPRDLESVPAPLPFALAQRKEPGMYRIFVLGESAAMGFPDCSTSFARILEVLLRARYPTVQFEVVNTAMVAINSHVALPIARQCARCEPDVLVVHLGNNEVVGPFGAGGVLGPFSPHRRIIQANLAAKTTHTGQLLDRLVGQVSSGAPAPRVWDGMAMFTNNQVRADDERLPRIHGHFRDNLTDICRAGTSAGARVILCTIPVNLRDSAPFASLHAADLTQEHLDQWQAHYDEGVRREAADRYAEAESAYARAAAIDGAFAELVHRHGRCAEKLGRTGDAVALYRQARDLDTMRFRSDSTINATIRAVAAAQDETAVRLADAERAFDAASSAGVPGDELFLEHVHMTFKGNYLLARTMLDTIAALAPPPALAGGAGQPMVPGEEECARQMGQTDWSRWKVMIPLYGKLLAGPPFTGQYDHAERMAAWQQHLRALEKRFKDGGGYGKAVADYQRTIERHGNDWMIRLQFGELLSEAGRPRDALEQFQLAISLLRHQAGAHAGAGGEALKLGDAAAAERYYRDAVALAPEDIDNRLGLAKALEAQGLNDSALAVYVELLSRSPRRADAPQALGRFLYRTGKFDAAWTQLDEALRRDPKRAAIHVDLGLTAEKLQRPEDAIAHFDAALKLEPDWPELRQHLMEARKASRERQ
jgi:tetratricopeptide (TPR) repeat protein